MQITQELLRQLFDYKEGFLYWKIRRSGIQIGAKAGCLHRYKDGDRYRIRTGDKNYLSSRIIFLYHHGFFPEVVDHINHITTDDRIENLRAANNSQNAQNRQSVENSRSKFKGVSWHNHNKKWVVQINIKGKNRNIGRFDTEIEAALAYNKAAKKHYKEFAHINSI